MHNSIRKNDLVKIIYFDRFTYKHLPIESDRLFKRSVVTDILDKKFILVENKYLFNKRNYNFLVLNEDIYKYYKIKYDNDIFDSLYTITTNYIRKYFIIKTDLAKIVKEVLI